MTTRCTTLVLAVAAAAVSGGAQEAAFLEGVEHARRHMRRGRWDAAERTWRELLERHRGALYVTSRRSEILEDLRRCAFQRTLVDPDPSSLVSGTFRTCDLATGRVEIHYAPELLDDFEMTPDGAFVHPLVFSGPVTITVRGSKYPDREAGMRLFVGLDGEIGYDVVFGWPAKSVDGKRTWVPMSVARVDRAGRHQLAVAPSRARPGRPFTVRVVVQGAWIEAWSNGRRLMRVQVQEPVVGRVGFAPAPFEELVLEGTANPAWIQGRLDAWRERRRREFDETYDAREHAPSWLLKAGGEEAAATPPGGVLLRRVLPDRIESRQVEDLNRAIRLLNAKHYREALRYVADLDPRQAPPATRSYLLALAEMHLGRLPDALARVRSVLRAEPDFVDGRALEATILLRMRRRDEALAKYRDMVTEFPDDAAAAQNLALLLLRDGDLEGAAAVVRRARRARARGVDLDALERMLVMARGGPAWHRVHEVVSRHYRVRSDIDRKTCREAAQVLEEAYVAYQNRLVRAPIGERRFRVYLFSGRTGYLRYCRRILGDVRMHTSGLYSPTLKQLLVWNLPDREEMMRTVRHEGFHQYLDTVMEEPPPWFNEGMAEYYEVGEVRGGVLETGQAHPEHVAYLREHVADLRSIEEIVGLDADTFYATARASYAESWALVHFLRHSSRRNAWLFRRIFDALREPGRSPREALRIALAGVDLDRLEAEFRAYVSSL